MVFTLVSRYSMKKARPTPNGQAEDDAQGDVKRLVGPHRAEAGSALSMISTMPDMRNDHFHLFLDDAIVQAFADGAGASSRSRLARK